MVASVYTRCINALVTKHQDYDRSAIDNYLLSGSCVLFTNFGTLPEFDLVGDELSGGVCAIRCLRTSGANPPANKEFLAIVHVVGTETVNVTGTRKIFIEIPENLVNDGTLINSEVTGVNDQRLGLGIAVIKSELTYPAHTNYIPLWEIDAGVPTDVRPILQLKGDIFSTVPAGSITGGNWKLFATNGSGVLQEISFGNATQVLTSNGLTALPSWTSPSADIDGLAEDVNNGYLDKIMVYVPGEGNKKRDIEDVIKNIIRQCGEDINAQDCVCIGTLEATTASSLTGATGDNTAGIKYSTTYWYQSQSFSLGSDTKIYAVRVSLRKVGNPTGVLYLTLHNDTGVTYYPSVSIPINEADLTTSFADYYFYFPAPVEIDGGVTYYITITSPRAVNTSNYSQWAYGGSYGGGDGFRVNSAGVPVFTSLGSDRNFTVYGWSNDNKFYKANQYSQNIVGLALYSGLEDEYIEAGVDIAKASGLTPGSKYFLPVVPGAPTLTPSYRSIGTALSSTKFLIDIPTLKPVAGTSVTLADRSGRPNGFNGTTYTKRKEMMIKMSGTYTVTFSMIGNGVAGTVYAQIYRNGVAVGTERTIASSPQTLTEFSENIEFMEGDTLEIRTKVSVGTAAITIRQVKLQCSMIPRGLEHYLRLSLG